MAKVCSFLSLRDQVSLSGSWSSLWFDAGRQQMILLQDDTFLLWSLEGHDSRPHKLLQDDTIPKTITFAKLSMDSQLLALQLSEKIVVVYDLKTKKKWKILIKNVMGNQILKEGLIWSEHGGNSQDLVVVTSKGIELHKISSARGQCKLSRSIMQTTHFFRYEPNFRAVLLGCTSRDHTLEITGFYLRYDLSDAPRLELPPPDKMPIFRLDDEAASENLRVIVLYGVLYLAVHYRGINTATDSIALYDLSRGQNRITRTYTFPLYMSGDVDLSVTDNILCCHCLENQLTFLFDVRHREGVAGGEGQMTLGACTLIVDDETIRDGGGGGISENISTGTIANNLSSPVKQLLQGGGDKDRDRDGTPGSDIEKALCLLKKAAMNTSMYKLNLKQVFKDIDVSGDGFVSLSELRNFLATVGLKMENRFIDALFRHFDPNNSGSIHYGEFCWAFFNRRSLISQWKQNTKTLNDRQIKSKLHQADRNGNGILNRKEFSRLLKSFSIKMSDMEIDLLIDRFDRDGDGELDLKEFTAFIEAEINPSISNRHDNTLSSGTRPLRQSMSRSSNLVEQVEVVEPRATVDTTASTSNTNTQIPAQTQELENTDKTMIADYNLSGSIKLADVVNPAQLSQIFAHQAQIEAKLGEKYYKR